MKLLRQYPWHLLVISCPPTINELYFVKASIPFMLIFLVKKETILSELGCQPYWESRKPFQKEFISQSKIGLRLKGGTNILVKKPHE
jgi:hypothetical protein